MKYIAILFLLFSGAYAQAQTKPHLGLFRADSLYASLSAITDTTNWKPIVSNSAGKFKRSSSWYGGSSGGAVSADANELVYGTGSGIATNDALKFTLSGSDPVFTLGAATGTPQLKFTHGTGGSGDITNVFSGVEQLSLIWNNLAPGGVGTAGTTGGRAMSIYDRVSGAYRWILNADGTYRWPAYAAGGYLKVDTDGDIFLDAGSGGGGSQWTDVTGGINYSAGLVGIGDATPDIDLDILRVANTAIGVDVINTSTGSSAAARYYAQTNAGLFQFGIMGAANTAFGAGGEAFLYADQPMIFFSDDAAGYITFGVNGSEKLRLATTGVIINSGSSSLALPTTRPGTNGYAPTFNTDGSFATWASIAGGGSGTVTSVGMTVPSFLSVSGSPVTSSGTLAVTLSGTALPAANGGTGQTSYTTGDLLYASGTSALSKLTAGTSGYYLGANGAGVAPSWKVMPGSGQDAVYATFDVVTTNATETLMNGSMQVSNGEYGMIEVSIYNVNSLSNAGYSRKFILPYRGTSTTAVAIGAQDDIQTERAWGSLGFEDCDMTVVSNGAGDIIITVFGISGQNIQWRAEIKKYSVFWSA